jgi:hypothetical protein
MPMNRAERRELQRTEQGRAYLETTTRVDGLLAQYEEQRDTLDASARDQLRQEIRDATDKRTEAFRRLSERHLV